MSTRQQSFALLLAVVCSACTSGDDRQKKGKSTSHMNVPTCASLVECRKHDGKLIEVTGTYSEIVIPSKRSGHPPLRFPALDVGDRKLYLGVGWAPRSEEERKELLGKHVRVRGEFHEKPPPHPSAKPGEVSALAGGPTIHPIESIAAQKGR